jgi:hypothetical protein
MNKVELIMGLSWVLSGLAFITGLVLGIEISQVALYAYAINLIAAGAYAVFQSRGLAS